MPSTISEHRRIFTTYHPIMEMLKESRSAAIDLIGHIFLPAVSSSLPKEYVDWATGK